MGVALVQTANATAGALSFTFGAAPTNGNLMVVIMGHFQNGPSWGNGWTQLFTQNASQWDVSAAYKYAGAGESATQQPLTTGSSGRDLYAFELSGVTGTIGTDIPRSSDHNVDVTVTSSAYSSTSFNSTANNIGIVGVLGAATVNNASDTFSSASLSGGVSPVLANTVIDNTGHNRNTIAKQFTDYFATSGTAVQYTLGSISGSLGSGSVGWYSLIEIANFSAPTIPVSIAESITLSDTFTAVSGFSASISEALTVTDLYTVEAADEGAIAELISITDTYTVASSLHDSISEAIVISDALSAASALHDSISESIVLSDVYAASSATVVSISESIQIADFYSNPIFGPTPEPVTEGWWHYFYTDLIVWIGYDPSNELLEIFFTDGSERTYAGVPFGIAQAFVTANDPDNYWRNAINGNYTRVFA